MNSEQIWALIIGSLTRGYGIFILSHLVRSYRRPLRWARGRGALMSRFAITLTGGSLLLWGMTAFTCFFVPSITPIAFPIALLVFMLAGFTAGLVDDLRK